jgi:hypothetical protein
MMATTVEAILGAVHLDGGDQALASVMIKLGLTSDLLVTSTILPFVRSVLRAIISISTTQLLSLIGSLHRGP